MNRGFALLLPLLVGAVDTGFSELMLSCVSSVSLLHQHYNPADMHRVGAEYQSRKEKAHGRQERLQCKGLAGDLATQLGQFMHECERQPARIFFYSDTRSRRSGMQGLTRDMEGAQGCRLDGPRLKGRLVCRNGNPHRSSHGPLCTVNYHLPFSLHA